MKEVRIIIAGSRTFEEFTYAEYHIKNIFKEYIRPNYKECKPVIVSGCARGADMIGIEFARKYSIALKEMPADWAKNGKRAGFIRNEEMAKFATEDDNVGILIAFWDYQSKGTENMIKLAEKYNIKTYVIGTIQN